jgi:aromatic ring-opening dioxygenase LigB subunit
MKEKSNDEYNKERKSGKIRKMMKGIREIREQQKQEETYVILGEKEQMIL